MAEELVNKEEVTEPLPSRQARHQNLKKKNKRRTRQAVKAESASDVQQVTVDEEETNGQKRSQIFKRERERQGSIYVTTFIFWLFILLVGSLLFFSIRHYS